MQIKAGKIRGYAMTTPDRPRRCVTAGAPIEIGARAFANLIVHFTHPQ
jgi:hypothetical protein